MTLPPNSKIFTADATAMYTNIDTATDIKAIKDILNQYNNQIDTLFPREFFLSCLEIVMGNNIFSFGYSSRAVILYPYIWPTQKQQNHHTIQKQLVLL